MSREGFMCAFCGVVGASEHEICPVRAPKRHRLVAQLPAASGLGQTVKATAPAKAGRSGFTPASKPQRAAITDRPSLMPGQGPIDPAHITPRANGGCDDPLCVVPLHRTAHRAFDDGDLDILGAMIANGLWAEMAHAIEAHQVDPISLLQRLTGQRWAPVDQAGENQAA